MQELAKHYSKELRELKNNNENSTDELTITHTNSALNTIETKCKRQECKPEFKIVDLDKK